MRHRTVRLLAGMTAAVAALALAAPAAADTTVTTGAWTPGSPTGPGGTVPVADLHQLPGGTSGSPIVVSNNPETFTGNGWLMLHSRTTSTRGGSAHALSGTFPIYLYHQNGAGSTRYLHVFVTNPNAGSVTVSASGAAYTNAQKPLTSDPAQRAGTGPCYAVADAWSRGTTSSYLSGVSVAPGQAKQITRITMNASNIADGRFEVTASAGVYVYTAVTSDGNLGTAVNLSQQDTSYAPGNIKSETATTYGREAGVYSTSGWDTQTVNAPLPPAGNHYGLAVNTTSRQIPAPDQTTPALAALADSSTRSWGNYGHHYTIRLVLQNTAATSRTARVTFGSNITGATDVPGNTWNGPIAVTDNGTTVVQTVYTRPTVPLDQLGTYTVAPGASRTLTLDFYVPGLITAGSQLLLESI
ncbi:DUF3370 family protein [Catellatospora sp. KI3]|uniref:DUF3370 family protein n=1 Tax=Catellatospora sp. KI3 TaxID=3041620 RepID=UPI0024826912|nr:DUF3370 family protein [Catellatospora sp. KI3]MDI1463449.1 DUF3370 family protein [Catellatospora sp. KI3]